MNEWVTACLSSHSTRYRPRHPMHGGSFLRWTSKYLFVTMLEIKDVLNQFRSYVEKTKRNNMNPHKNQNFKQAIIISVISFSHSCYSTIAQCRPFRCLPNQTYWLRTHCYLYWLWRSTTIVRCLAWRHFDSGWWGRGKCCSSSPRFSHSWDLK